MLSGEERAALLESARMAVRAACSGGPLPPSPAGGVFDSDCGAFVTLKRKSDGSLRGCIGSFTAAGTLGRTVVRMAAAAAMDDPRFQPVRPDEVPLLRVEISVLSPMVRTDPADVVTGTHGVYVRSGRFGGTLLPQVAAEEGWGREQLLSHTCLKAGLPPGAWKTGTVEVFTYTAEVFSEQG